MGSVLTTQAGRRGFTGFEPHPSQPEGLQDLPPAPEEAPRSGLICPLGSSSCPTPANIYLGHSCLLVPLLVPQATVRAVTLSGACSVTVAPLGNARVT